MSVLSTLVFVSLAAASPLALDYSSGAAASYNAVCAKISKQVSYASAVYYPTSISPNYQNDIQHWFNSSIEDSACVVEVGSDADTSAVLKIIASTKTPFAVKSGGHASNQGFSSTLGVQISLVRLKQVIFSADQSTLTVGLGNIWTDVYRAIDGTGRNIVGGRVNGPGTGGFTLGGGYSWVTNQYGLTCDTVHSYTLITPSGKICQITSSQPDLFFALKGGLNRFGIVTTIVYRTIPQIPTVYGGYQVYDALAIPDLLNATNYFQNHNTDPKAQVILTVESTANASNAVLLSFYDGPTRPAALAPYDNIPFLEANISSRSFLDFVQSTPSQDAAGSRGAFHTLSTTSLTPTYLAAIYNETLHHGILALNHSGITVSYDIEPFGKYGKYATDSAYPHTGSPLPLNLFFSWADAADDAYWRGLMVQSAEYLTAVAKREGIFPESENVIYPNYALSSVEVEQLYGPANVERLRWIRAAVDPQRVMDLTGGFKL